MRRAWLALLLCYHVHILVLQAAVRISKPEPKNPYRREYGNVTVNPHNFEFIHKPQPCDESRTVLVSIHSATQNYNRRRAIRSTWGNPYVFQQFLPEGYRTKLIFVLGLPNNTGAQPSIDYESEFYKDIVQADFLDSYYNNTFKAIYNMKWASAYYGCPKVQLIIKADDDVMFNMVHFPRMWESFLSSVGTKLHSEYPLMAGYLWGGGPHRNPKDKWYLSYEAYKYDTFPPWFQGMVYLLTPVVARHIYELSFTTPYLFTDDLYVGIVADRVEGISRIDLHKYITDSYTSPKKAAISWQKSQKLFYHTHSIKEMFALWFTYCSYESCLRH